MKRVASPRPFTLAVALFLSACSGSPPDNVAVAAAAPAAEIAASPIGPTPTEQLAQLEKEGKLPKLDRSASVAGADMDGNGVRDDIDDYLRQRFSNAPQHAAAVQMAKAMQSAVLTGGSSAEASQAVSRQIFNAVICLDNRFDGSEGANTPGAVGDEIEAITTNTKNRLFAYLAYNKSRNGTSTTLPDGDTCE